MRGAIDTETYVRNVLEQPVEVIDPLERKTKATSDATGNLKTKEDPDDVRRLMATTTPIG